jgi:hypothetical protein
LITSKRGIYFFIEAFPAFRTRYFVYFGAAAKLPRRNKQNELKQLLQSGLK